MQMASVGFGLQQVLGSNWSCATGQTLVSFTGRLPLVCKRAQYI